MRYIDRAFAFAVLSFLGGACIGATLVLLSSNVREFAVMLLQARMVYPLRAVSPYGSIATFLVVFMNNSVPAVLSFAYPLAIARITWTPPLSDRRMSLLLGAYTYTATSLVGLFSLGMPLAIGWAIGGSNLFFTLISRARIHGPLEFGFVLVCLAEPLRLVWTKKQGEVLRKLSDDRQLLIASIVALLVSAAIEVFLGI
jgi:hypothetical protein